MNSNFSGIPKSPQKQDVEREEIKRGLEDVVIFDENNRSTKKLTGLKGLHEGGAKEVFIQHINEITTKYGLEFNEKGQAYVSGVKLIELVDAGVMGDVSYHDEHVGDSEENPRMSNKILASFDDIKLELFWEYAHFSLPYVPEEIERINPQAYETQWVARINVPKEKQSDM